jgi:hypothetical protein
MNRKSLALLIVLLAPVSAHAQGWRDYSYADDGFMIAFPAPPAMTSGVYKTTTGVSVPARTYSVQADNIVYSVTAADFSKTNMSDQAGIGDAVKAFGAMGEVKLDVEARTNQRYGRELSVIGKDASRSMVAIFFIDHKLYALVGKALPPNAETKSGLLIRFEESLNFAR